MITDLIKRYGYADFQAPPTFAGPSSAVAPYELVVKYSNGTIAGCGVQLRSYNGNLVGPTIRAKPGDTLYIRLTNKLPADLVNEHPQDPHSPDHSGHFSFNITNLHTHGLNTSPNDDGDNVFLEIHPETYPGDPKGTQLYKIHIHDKHPTGTFWYHSHFHGGTALQVSSGMAGALIIEDGTDANGGLDAVPEIRAAEQKIFVLQQIRFGPDGKLEDFEKAIPVSRWSRNITVNGIFVPTIKMRPGEVQRWRFVHAGVEDNIALSLDSHQLHEIAADGLALGRLVAWPALEKTSDGVRELLLGPGYRTDVLVKAAPLPAGELSKEYLLRDGMLPTSLSLQAATSAVRALRAARTPNSLNAPQLLADIGNKPERIIARIIVEGAPNEMALPSNDQLRDRVPSELTTITDDKLTGIAQSVHFEAGTRKCTPDGDCSTPCDDDSDECKTRFTLDDRVFMADRAPRLLKLGTASEWTLTGDGIFPHPFHIHVNPFELTRDEPGPDGRIVKAKIWKDTLLLPKTVDQDGNVMPIRVRSRYLRFDGDFVIHCHILGHEDQGMMERVRIEK